MRKWLIVIVGVLALAVAGCSSSVRGEAVSVEPMTTTESASTPASSGDLSVTQMCESLLGMLDSLGQLDPSVDSSDTLKSVFEESHSSDEWKSTPLEERHRIEEAFARAESGRC